MALSLKVCGSFSDDGESMYMEDCTGFYNSVSNTGGYSDVGYGGSNVTTQSVTSFQVTCNWISAGAIVTYNFTASGGVITAASVTDNEGTTYDFLADLASTAFPIVDPNFLDLTDTFDDNIVLPELTDGQFMLTYKIIGVSSGSAYNYTTSTTYFRTSDLCCCISATRLTADPNNPNDPIMCKVNKIVYWLDSALCAVDAGKSNSIALQYFTLAQAICDDDCSCCD